MPYNLAANDSLSDLCEDLSELRYLYEDRLAAFDKFLKKIRDKNLYQNKNTYDSLIPIGEKITGALNRNYKRLNVKKNNIADLIRIKNSSYEALRSIQLISASFFTSLNYQSPSFLHSVSAQAGLDLNRILANENDYKRDVHLDGIGLER